MSQISTASDSYTLSTSFLQMREAAAGYGWNLAFGDIALVPAPWLKDPRGIRDVAEWYISTALRPNQQRRTQDQHT